MSAHVRGDLICKLAFLAFDGDGQPVAHREHAQIDALVQVQLLIQGVQDYRFDVTRSWMDNFSTPQHL